MTENIFLEYEIWIIALETVLNVGHASANHQLGDEVMRRRSSYLSFLVRESRRG
jgi:hypothetical protein